MNKKFYTPSGNIYCNLGADLAKGCEIGEGRIQDPAACRGNPMSKSVGRLEFRRFKVQPVCNTDTIRTPGTRVLPYGQATASGNLLPQRGHRRHLRQHPVRARLLPAPRRVRALQRRRRLTGAARAA